MTSFKFIPIEILRIIQQYLNKYNYRELLNTSKEIFQHAKYETIYYNIIIDNRFALGGKIQEFYRVTDHIKSFVKDINQQISVKINHPHEDILQYCDSLISGIHKLIILGNKRNGSHEFWRNHPNMSLFENIYHVYLVNIEGIDRLSGLSCVKILEVRHSQSIVAIDFIPELIRLIIYKLPNLVEISHYGNIPQLEMRYCSKISLQGLGNHMKVSLRDSDDNNTCDVFMFRNVKHFQLQARSYYPSLSSFPMFVNLEYLDFHCINNNELFDISYFPNLRSLRLWRGRIGAGKCLPSTLECSEFHSCFFDDLSVFANVKELKFFHCKGTEMNNVVALSQARKLVLIGLDDLEDVSCLGQVYDLRIAYCMKVIDISKLGRVHRLRVEYCGGVTLLEGLGGGNSEVVLSCFPNVIDFSPLKSIYKVTLEWCDCLIGGSDLANVQHLTLYRCKNFEDTSALGGVKSLYLVQCYKVKRLVGLENVPHIHIESCYGLESLGCLGKQQSLIIQDCLRLIKNIVADNQYEKVFTGIPFVQINKAFSPYSSTSSRERPDLFDD